MTITDTEPFMSVVLPVYNGGATIGRAVDSLLAQDYPRDRFEIIVVNDGSTDNTSEVVAKRDGVHLVELPGNMGQAIAQNAGLAVARGEIFVSFNDDCQAAPDFLKELARGYAKVVKPIGVGGIAVRDASNRARGLAAKYIEATHMGTAPSVSSVGPAFLPAVVKRFLAYIVENFRLERYNQRGDWDYRRVVELYGQNASFPIPMLQKIGGWDASLAAPAIGGIEDRDICFRLRQQFPDHNFYATRSARIMPDLDPNDSAVSMKAYLLRPYRRGPFNYAFHVKNGMVPPFSPFPALLLLTLVSGAALAPQLLPPLVVLAPQLCYPWWIWRAITEHRPMYILFPYLQAAEEAMVWAGLLRGLIAHIAGRRYATKQRSASRTPGSPPVT